MATVKLFGAFQDLAGWAERQIDAATLGALTAAMAESHPRLVERLAHPSTLVIVNAALLPPSLPHDAYPLASSDEIAFGPPVSGG
ncbi:molybdopterin converting factor subunit 1 [soil metagenome]